MDILGMMQLIFLGISISGNIWNLIKLYKLQKVVECLELSRVKGYDEPKPVLRRLITKEDERRVEKFIDTYFKN